jgi:hypothetical protein
MFLLQIEHPVADFDDWKKTFDSDPLNRRQSGVKQYRIYKRVDNVKYIVVELELESLHAARVLHDALKKMWNRVEGTVITNPKIRLLELVEKNDG